MSKFTLSRVPTIDDIKAAEAARRATLVKNTVKAAPVVEIDPGGDGFFLQLDDSWVIRGDGGTYTLCEIREISGEGRGSARAKAHGTIGQTREVIVGYHGNLRCACIQYAAKAPGFLRSQNLETLVAKLDAIDATINRCFPVKR